MRTRFAPSPTGPPHLGSLRTAYQNWLAARSAGGQFIVRIDDTDKKRSDPRCIDKIFYMLRHFDLDYDQIVYQSKRTDIYKFYAQNLMDAGFAKKDADGAILCDLSGVDVHNWTDGIAGNVQISANDRHIAANKVLFKQDGSPSYNFASVVDDIDLEIDCIIRGKDHTNNTSFQALLFAAIGKPMPKCFHVGLITKDGKKLSKRDNDLDLTELMNQYHPDAILNCIARLGWSPTVDDKSTKLLPRTKMLDMFWDKGKLKNKDASFDIAKLQAWDRKYRALTSV